MVLRYSDSTAPNNKPPYNANNAVKVNILTGGNFGYAPKIPRFIDNAAYVQQQLVCNVISTPRFIDYIPGAGDMHGLIRSLMEDHTREITGFTEVQTNNFIESSIGAGGKQQHDFAGATRTFPEPNHLIPEKYGFMVNGIFDFWSRWGLGDSDTQIPLVSTVDNPPPDLLPDMRSMTCLYYEPDPVFQNPVKAWLVVNMMPRSTGTNEARRNKDDTPGETTHSIAFTGTPISNYEVMQLAKKMMANIRGANPYFEQLPSVFKSVDANIAAFTGSGFNNRMQQIAKTQVSHT